MKLKREFRQSSWLGAKFFMLVMALTTTLLTVAQTTLQQGAQITAESNMVSGRPYLLMYIGNNSCYVKANSDNNYFKAVAGDLSLTDEAIYYFIGSTDNWQIQSRKTGKYFPVPTEASTTFVPVSEVASAGSWALNFQTEGNIGNIAPSCSGFSLNRSQVKSMGTSVLHGWDLGQAQANQLKIFEIALSTKSIVETEQIISVSGSGETTLTTNQWYVLKSASDYFIDDAANSFITTTAPKGFGINNSKYLVRLTDAGDSKYYVETGFGNYLFGADANTTTRVSATAYTADQLKANWEFHKLVDPIHPTATEVYTLNGSGAWIFAPTGFTNQYYMYNTVTQQFAYPTASGEWTESAEAVPVLLESQGDSHYCITTKDGTKTFKIGEETHMTITKSGDASGDQTTQLNTALGNLLSHGVSKLTEPSQISAGVTSNHTDGWYALRIHSDSNYPEYAGNFLYTLAVENQANGRPHPMSQGKDYMKHPLKDDALYYVRLWPVTGADSKTYYHWQVPSGKYVVNHGNDYPITWIKDVSDFVIGQNGDGTFYIQSSGYRAQILKDGSGNDYLGKTHSKYITSPTRLDIYPVNVTAAGLTPWKVIFNKGADDVKLHYNGSAAVKGLTDVYNNGYFFFPTGVTPGAGDFQISGSNVTAEIHGASGYDDPYTIHVVYAPDICFNASNVTVDQGSRTTGLGNTQQALLRVKINPLAPCYPKSLDVTLTGASNLTKVEAYLTTADQLHADGVTPVKLGELENPSEGNINIPTYTGEFATWPDDHLLMTGEPNYIWITADISSAESVEANEVDAALTKIEYVNAANHLSYTEGFAGDPAGKMRIFMRQQYLWVSTDENADESHFYRNPAILSLGDGKVLAFSEYRYDDVSELGHDVDDSDYGHRIDIVMRKSTDNGATWSDPATIIATGTDATESTKASGYSKPAVVLTKKGKIICLMAMGSDAYDSSTGLRHIGMTTSSNGGDTWSDITDIYNTIDWGTHSPSSAYITAGKGVTLPNGRVAFALNERNGSQTNEYVLYSDDEGVTWKLATDMVFGNGKEAKLEVLNDNRLLATISRGDDSEHIGRGYNYTTGNASSGAIAWDHTVSHNWSSLNSYGRNNDILYYGRGTNGFATTDVVLHTVYNNVLENTALRLYASFDQAATWNEFFTILPANTGVSAMQRLSDDNLAIAFEDGSIGGGANGSYALNYVVIHGNIFQMQVSDLMSSYPIKEGETNSSAPFVTWATSGWTKAFTTTAASGFAGVVVESSYSGAFNREGGGPNGQRVLDLKVSGANTSNTITITAPDGFIIKSYSIKGYNNNSGETYTLSDGTTSVDWNGGKGSPVTFAKDGIDAQSTTFTITSAGTASSSNYANITEFKVVLAPGYYTVPLNKINASGPGDTKSYATLYAPFDLTIPSTDTQTKAYYITEVTDGKAKLTETANIPKLTAVVLINSGGNASASFNVATTLTSVVSADDNLLKGTLVPLTIDLTTASKNYSLGRKRADESSPYVAGFYKYDNAAYTLGANRAYLDLTTLSASSSSYVFSFDDDGSTSIVEIRNDYDESSKFNGQSSKFNDQWYTLDGRKLNGLPTSKGLYIVNGKKMIIK